MHSEETSSEGACKTWLSKGDRLIPLGILLASCLEVLERERLLVFLPCHSLLLKVIIIILLQKCLEALENKLNLLVCHKQWLKVILLTLLPKCLEDLVIKHKNKQPTLLPLWCQRLFHKLMALSLLRKTRIPSPKLQALKAIFQLDQLSLSMSMILMKMVLFTTLAQTERKDYGRTLTLLARFKPSPHL